jgi:hypothetical protein
MAAGWLGGNSTATLQSASKFPKIEAADAKEFLAAPAE